MSEFSTMDFNTMNEAPIGCGCAACRDAHLVGQNLGEPGQGSSTFINNGPDKLLSGSVWANDKTGITLNYNFWNSLPSYYSGLSDEANGFTAFTSSMQVASEKVFSLIETFTNITFVETTSEAATEIGMAQASLPDGVGAWAYYPHSSAFGGDVWTNTKYVDDSNISEGDYGFYALMHEVGHALGLQHTFSGGLTGAQNTEQYSVMAYDRTPWGDQYAETFQLYDIWALQELYGANTSYNSGDTVYALQSGKAYTIWDGGGDDTLDGSANSSNQVISLREGTFSSVGLTDNIAVAYDVVIENARGGSGHDVIDGNDADNNIFGNAGNDRIYASDGLDFIDGGIGTDTVIYEHAYTNYQFSQQDSDIVVRLTDSIVDTLRNIEEFIFDGISLLYSDIESLFGVGGTQDVINQYAPLANVGDVTLLDQEVVLASTVINGNDADNNTLTFEVWDGGSASNTAYFQLDGNRLASGQSNILTQAEFDRLELVGGSDILTEQMWLRVRDGTYSTTWKVFQVNSDISAENIVTNDHAPVVSVSNAALTADEVILASTVIGASDADGNDITYQVWDGGASGGSAFFRLDGNVLASGQAIALTQAEFDRLELVGGSDSGTENMWLRAFDSSFATGWAIFTVTTTSSGSGGGGGGGTNDNAPVVSVSNAALTADEVILASTVIGASDADGNDITYQVWDGGASGGSAFFRLDGNVLASGQAIALTQAEFDRLELVGGSDSGTENMWLRAFDSSFATGWAIFTVTTTSSGSGGGGGGGTNDNAPVVSVSNAALTADEVILASTVIGASDADGNDITYHVWDGGGGESTAFFNLDGNRLASGQSIALTQAEFDRLEIVGGTAAGVENMWLRASDGVFETGWAIFTVTTTSAGSGGGGSGGGTNDHAPVVSVSNAALAEDEVILASTVIGATDADGNDMTYEVWDGGTSGGSSFFRLDSNALATGQSISLTQAEFDRLELVGGSDIGTENMWLRVSDGVHTSTWSLFTVTSSGNGEVNNHTPTVIADDVNINNGQAILASNSITANDADGNEITYDVWDSAGGHYLRLDGQTLNAGQSNFLTQAEFDRLEIVGNGQGANEMMWVRVLDGVHQSGWVLFRVHYDATASSSLGVEDVLDYGSLHDELFENFVSEGSGQNVEDQFVRSEADQMSVSGNENSVLDDVVYTETIL